MTCKLFGQNHERNYIDCDNFLTIIFVFNWLDTLSVWTISVWKQEKFLTLIAEHNKNLKHDLGDNCTYISYLQMNILYVYYIYFIYVDHIKN